MKSSRTIPLAIIFAGIVIAVALYVQAPKRPKDVVGDPSLVLPISASDHILGNPAAQVMIVEYSDFDCDYCKDLHTTLEQVIANAGVKGNVAWVFRQFPITEKHQNALSHARASECAAHIGGNDLFWKFAHALFENQPVTPARYGEIAASVGISGNSFASCVASPPPALEARITADRENALLMKAPGTPYSLILVEGKPSVVMSGAYPYYAIKDLVDEALQSIR